ncbi:zinc finger CCCH domain-containing protein 7B isoform X3 [Ascaphus truei]|uniref:zinc finger CCCH domain-containing protein 7B isoform X3 n=1 Tax=Ascaphus truei TaxID=8439 RepID=UPI003F5A3998
MERQRRTEDIEKGLQFIQSTIPFHGSQADYESFLQQLVRNLFAEGNDLYREGDPKLALGQYTEGLTVAEYAASDDLSVPRDLVCKLNVNRACCYYSMGLFEKSLEDSEKALSLEEENMRALYRKAKALNQLGRHQDAYGCISHRLLALVRDESVTELAQELVQKLGLKQRKAYKRPQQELETLGVISNGISNSASSQTSSNSLGSLDDIDTDFPLDMKSFPSPTSSDSLSEGLGAAVSSSSAGLPPAAVTLSNFADSEVIGDELDSLLDSEMTLLQTSIPPSQVPQLIPVFPTGNHLLSSVGSLAAPSALPPASFGLLDSRKLTGPLGASAYSMNLLTFAEPRLDTLDNFESCRETLDSLDTFTSDPKFVEAPSAKGNQAANPMSSVNPLNHLFPHNLEGAPIQIHFGALPSALAPAARNPLALTHDFRQACQQCYVKIGPRALDYSYREGLEHKCKKDVLMARMKSAENKTWLRIRSRPMKVNFMGPYILCKDILSRQDCKYGDNCTFAYYQEEIDVWNAERKGILHRVQLFQTPGGVIPGGMSVTRLLQEHKGIFIFLCQSCFDSKPQIINRKSQENPRLCNNLTTPHSFPDHKCLVHVLNSGTYRYSKIRPLHPRFQLDVCRHQLRYGCLQEDTCNFAHSQVELGVWMLQRHSGITQDDIVLEGDRFWKAVQPKATPPPKSLDMKGKFICGQCWRNGREVEADREGKYCTAKARHSWTKDKRILLVMSKAKKRWVPVRPLPSIRSFPQQYETCVHVQKGKKCQYIGNCTFAHSPEEKDIWTFMKENKVLDLQLIFELCQKYSPGKAGEGAAAASKEGEKQIVMPTDYVDVMAGFHCYLCGKNSNSDRQWQKHIQSEKHKERVFTSNSEDSAWKYRFPMGEFQLCDSIEKTQSCPEEDQCLFAHGQEELDEWLERRELLQQKVSKARKDMLLEPSDNDFGKYNFLLKDVV